MQNLFICQKGQAVILTDLDWYVEKNNNLRFIWMNVSLIYILL